MDDGECLYRVRIVRRLVARGVHTYETQTYPDGKKGYTRDEAEIVHAIFNTRWQMSSRSPNRSGQHRPPEILGPAESGLPDPRGSG